MNQQINKELNTILAEAYKDFQKGLHSYATYKISDHVAGQDLVQDTFMKTWKYLLKGGKILLMKVFLYHILNNLIVDEYRKNKPSSLDALVEKGFEPNVDDTESKKLFDTIDGQAASKLISRLPEMYQKILTLRYIQGLTLKEISAITGQTKNTIAVNVHRGLIKIRSLYGTFSLFNKLK